MLRTWSKSIIHSSSICATFEEYVHVCDTMPKLIKKYGGTSLVRDGVGSKWPPALNGKEQLPEKNEAEE